MKKINESFTCIHCKRTVPMAAKTCRNHCPFCFVSLHVDDTMPGDRKSKCGGMMYPISYMCQNNDRKILFQCNTCEKQHRNKRAIDDNIGELDTYVKQYRKKIT